LTITTRVRKQYIKVRILLRAPMSEYRNPVFLTLQSNPRFMKREFTRKIMSEAKKTGST
jgi:hypothetical protein